MDHVPTVEEQGVVDGLLENYSFDPVYVRLTPTMLDKGIMDAHDALRFHFARAGLAEFVAIPPLGAEFGVKAILPLVHDGRLEQRDVSFYRPKTKEGDPRFWIYGLGKDARPGQLLMAAFSGPALVFVLVGGEIERIIAALRGLLPPRESEDLVAKAISRVKTRVEELLRGGWVKTARAGDTGVGFTFEKAIGIAANVRKDADLDGVEIKAHRTGTGSRSDPLITLFSKTPVWGAVRRTAGLVNQYGYMDESGRRSLYCSIGAKQNRLGWSLRVAADAGRVEVCFKGEPILHYLVLTLQKRLIEKHSHTLFVSAEARGSGREEEFLFNTVLYCSEPSVAAFIELVNDGSICLDFVAHLRENGTGRDHGYLWRIRESRIPGLYAYKKQLV